jgi:hypothetical protein
MTSAGLRALGVSRQLARRYAWSGWIESLGTGAFARTGERVEWSGGLYALQTQLQMSVHVAALSALELQGRSHFVPMGAGRTVVLVSDRAQELPAWFRNHDWDVRWEHRRLTLFERAPDSSLVLVDCGGFDVSVSSPERAILEEMRLATTNAAVEHACQLVEGLVEGLALLRPEVTQELLENCRSMKVKRLFLWAAETTGHPWFQRLDISRIALGKGKRQIYSGGRFDRKYQTTVPPGEELPRV